MAIPSLCSGNSVLLRIAQSTPMVGQALDEIFKSCGLSDKIQITWSSSDLETADFILGQRKIKGISFTGSTRTGKQLAVIAAKHLKKSVFELGGSDPLLLLPDAKVDKAVDVAVRSRLSNSG